MQALIWAKKSTGLPINIKSAFSLDKALVSDTIANVILDIDIQRVI